MARRPLRKPRPPAPRRLSGLDLEAPADRPLDPEEVSEMRRHLAFIRRYQKVLRLRLNAREARMVDGSDPPTHRGACKHLLSKLDRSAFTAAIRRKPLSEDPAARAEFLAGAAGLSDDVGVLLNYLESLQEGDRRADHAFEVVTTRIDFGSLSPTQFGRLLSLMREVYRDEQLVQTLFGWLDNDTFRAVFDRNASDIPPDVLSVFAPLRVTWRFLEGRPVARETQTDLERGLRVLLESDTRAHKRATREKLAEAALKLELAWAADATGVRSVLTPLHTPTGLALGYLHATLLIKTGRPDEARGHLGALLKAHPHAIHLQALQAWLGKPRLGALAVEALQPGPLTLAFHLPSARVVFARLDRAPAADRPLLPGLAAPIDSGHDDGFSWVAVDASVPRLRETLGHTELGYEQARVVAAEGLRIVNALTLAGATLPDLDADRFLLDLTGVRPHLLLADLTGLAPGATPLDLQRQWCEAALSWPPFSGKKLRREVPPWLEYTLDQADNTEALLTGLRA